jgi:hypothetical protein
MRKTLLAFVVPFFVATVSLAVPVQADMLDSLTITVTCKNYTVRAIGHGLIHPNATIFFNMGIDEGGVGIGFAEFTITNIMTVAPDKNGAFDVSVTNPDTRPPYLNFFGFPGFATLTTGSMVWNSVTPNLFGTLDCPGSNKCPVIANQWANRTNWPIGRLVIGDPGYPNPPSIYNQAALRNILHTAPGTDESIILARQLIAAKLNLFNGVPRIVKDPGFGTSSGRLLVFVLTDNADGILSGGRLPQHVDPTSSLGQNMATYVALLYSYNSGALTRPNPDGTCN